MSGTKGKAASVQTGRIVGTIKIRPTVIEYPPVPTLPGICPKCKKGDLETTSGRYVAFQRGRRIESIDRGMYRCSNPACGNENVAIIIRM